MPSDNPKTTYRTSSNDRSENAAAGNNAGAFYGMPKNGSDIPDYSGYGLKPRRAYANTQNTYNRTSRDNFGNAAEQKYKNGSQNKNNGIYPPDSARINGVSDAHTSDNTGYTHTPRQVYRGQRAQGTKNAQGAPGAQFRMAVNNPGQYAQASPNANQYYKGKAAQGANGQRPRGAGSYAGNTASVKGSSSGTRGAQYSSGKNNGRSEPIKRGNPQNNRGSRNRSSPQNRSAMPRRPKSPEVIAAERAERRREARIRRYKTKQHFIIGIKLFLRRAVVTLIMFIIMLCAVATALYLDLNNTIKLSTKSFTYIVGDSTSGRTTSYLRWEQVYMNGTRYLNFNQIAKMCSMTVTGDSNELRFIAQTEAEDCLTVKNGATDVTLNGLPARMEAPAIFSGSTVYLPESFVEFYVDGVSVVYNETKNSITISRETYMDSLGYYHYYDVSFALKAPQTSEPISESSLSYSVKLATESADN